jgi:signal transduction histidine kinase
MPEDDLVHGLRSLTDRLGATAVAVRKPIFDVAAVLLTLAVIITHDRVDNPDADPTVWIFDVLLVLPLLWRRRHPVIVFLVISAMALVQWSLGVQVGADLALLISLYAVGAYEPRRWLIGGSAAIAQIGVILAAARWAPPGHGLNTTILLTGTVTAAWVLGVYVRTRRAYLSSVLERAATAERERDQQALIATASERARISREMHDIVAHSLSVIIALSDGAAIATTRTPEAARTAMLQSSALGRQALGEIRRLLGNLNEIPDDSTGVEDLAPQPGVADLDELINQVRSAGPAVDLVIIGRPPELAPGAELTIYRLIQEALTNVLKHAPSATRVVVTLRYGATRLDLEIENDDPLAVADVSAVPAPEASNGGHGLAGMSERAAAFAGTVEAGRGSNGGWRVKTHLELGEQDR